MHDLRNMLNAMQPKSCAARHLVDDGTQARACIGRIEGPRIDGAPGAGGPGASPGA